MPSLTKLPLPVKELFLPLRYVKDDFELSSFFNYRTLAASFPGANAYESNQLGAVMSAYRKQGPLLDNSVLNSKNNIDWFLNHLPTTKDSRVLDLNCGSGVVSRELSPKVHSVVGTDVSRHLLEHAKNKPGLDNIEYIRAEASLLPFTQDTFDIVFSRFSFTHFMHRTEVINEMRRVCKPGGFICLLERVIPDDIDDATALRMEFIEGIRDKSHAFFITPAELQQLFNEGNIDVIKKETTTVAEPYESYLNQTNVKIEDRAAISQFIHANMILPDPAEEQTTGFFPHLVDDVVTLTHHHALIGGINPEEKPQFKE